MPTINFSEVGSFNGVVGGPQVLSNPTSLQFGPDGRLYVTEQNGSINAFTVELQDGEYVATTHEVLELANGFEAVRTIRNHNDDGSPNDEPFNRQVTGLLVTGTAENPVLYVSSSDPRISMNGDVNLDTNSGVITRITWTGTEWEAVDIIRGLPRSEENHSVNGLVLSPDGTRLYAAVGGNTNNGAPSQFFSFTSEFALAGAVIEIDLVDLESRPILTDPTGGRNGTPRQYIYDLPTLDDPTVPNDGVREDANGLDVAGPFGGNDGFNQAILPADAPIRIFADGLRNNFDLVLTQSGNLFTVDNGSNSNLGGDPIAVDGEASDLPNGGGTGSPEPLFLLTDGGFFGHPNPTRANQDLEFFVRDDAGNLDASLPVNSVPDLSALVPEGVDIAEGFIIDPSRFTGDPVRLAESGARIPFQAPESPALTTLGSSSNGLTEFTADTFDGALQGALLVAQFNGNVTLLNVNEAGTALEPLIDPGADGILGTADDEVLAASGVFPVISGQGLPLDVTVGPDGTIFVAEFGPNNINVFAPADFVVPFDTDFDDDGILNANDPFTRDATNGGAVTVSPGQTLIFDFDANQDDNRPGPDGFGGGLTGVQINNTTDFEEFFQEPSPFPDQLVNLDNVKFVTAAGGGTTVIENASSGTPFGISNDGEFLFQTGVTIAPTVETFTIEWRIFNPAALFTADSQRIGGFIGTGDQSDFLSITAGPAPEGEIQIVLEDNDVALVSSFIQADDLLSVPSDQQIFFEFEIDPGAATATPTIAYELGNGGTNTVAGEAIDLSGTGVLAAILGNHSIQGQTSGLAIGLLSTANASGDRPGADPFQAVFGDIEISAAPSSTTGTVLFRVNAGGPQIAAIDGGPDWLADTSSSNSAFLIDAGSNTTSGFLAVEPGPTVEPSVPGAIFDTERWDVRGGSTIEYAFDNLDAGNYEVRLYFGNGFGGTSAPGQRIFDVALEGSVPANLNNLDPTARFGHQVGGVVSNVVAVNDGTLNIAFLHDAIENPLINGIEILRLDGGSTPPDLEVAIAATQNAAEPASNGQFTVSLSEAAATDTVVAYTVTGTATAGSDYATLPGTVTIPAGALSATIDVAVLDDQIDEVDESVAIALTGITAGDSNVVLGATTAATITIADDDVAAPVPDVEVAIAATQNAAEPASNGQFTVSLSEAAATDTVVAYTVTGTAIAGSDYTALPGTVTIPAGALSATIDVAVLDDQIDEVDETVAIALSGITAGDSNVVLGATTSALVTITDDDVTVPTGGSDVVLFRINAGGPLVAANDDGPDWLEDSATNNSSFLVSPGSNNTAAFAPVDPGPTVDPSVPGAIFDSERWDQRGGSSIQYAFGGLDVGEYEVRLYFGNGSGRASLPGQRIFDVALEGSVPASFDDIDPTARFGHRVGGIISDVVTVTDGTLNIEFLHDVVENPQVNGIEIVRLGSDTPATPDVEVAIASAQNAAEPASNGQFTISLSEAASTDTVVAYAVTGTATAGSDYIALPGTVTIPAGALSATIDVAVLDDQIDEVDESVEVTLAGVTAGDSNVVLGADTAATITIGDDDLPPPVGNGEAVLAITRDRFNVQSSNFVSDSFQIFNTGEKAIAQVEIDVTDALFPDSVFDPFGLAGDTTSRPLTIDTDGGTGVLPATDASYVGAGGTAGFEILRIFFDEGINGGFEPGEMLGFSIDMDPNSIAGADRVLLMAGSDPTFDVGGISGAELLGSTFTVTFVDGTTATGQLQGVGNQAGSQALAAQDGQDIPVELTVNGLGAGGVGTYNADGPSVIVSGPAGQTARIVLTKGFIQPVNNEFFNGDASQQAFAPILQAQLDALAQADFPANNAVEFQTVDIVLTGGDQDISNLFNFSGVTNFDFAGEDRLPLGFVASIIDPADDDLPIGPVTAPIYLQFAEPAAPLSVSILNGAPTVGEGDGQVQISLATDAIVPNDDTVTVTFNIVPGTATPQEDYEYLSPTASFDTLTGIYSDTVTIAGGSADATFSIDILQDAIAESEEAFAIEITGTSTNAQIGTGTAAVAITDDDVAVPGAGAVLFRVNAGGPLVAATDGGPDWLADTSGSNSAFLASAGSNTTSGFLAVVPGPTVDPAVPVAILNTERWDARGNSNIEYAFDNLDAGDYEVRLYFGNGFGGTSAPGQRIFDVALEGSVPASLSDVDPTAQFGHQVGGVISNVVAVNDGTLNIEFFHDVIENPLINGIEIVQLG